MQYQIPQFIETEDKIIGPLSLRQFLWVGGGLGITMILYFALSFTVWVPIAILFTATGAAMGMIKINGRQLPEVVMNAARFYWQPRTYTWQPETKAPAAGEAAPKEAMFSLESIAAGMNLSHTWEKVQTGTVESKEKGERAVAQMKERYQVLKKMSGEREAARRIDYR
ncbi:MAG: PrgI family protein [Candidatus Liptonbacteria bacterium]